MSAYAEFELDLTQALLEKLPPKLVALDGAPLRIDEINRLPESVQGVYMLLEHDVPMYIGKTDAAHGFRTRLQRHFYTLSARKNLDLDAVRFKAVRIMVFTTVNVESTLIRHFLEDDPLRWQNSGFGSNDPGHNREGQEPSKFDLNHPISIDFPLGFVEAGEYSVHSLLMILKAGLPFNFRFQSDIKPSGRSVKHTLGHADQRDTQIRVPRDNMTLRELLIEVILDGLPPDWVATIFPGRVILYKDPTKYRYSVEQLRKA